MAPTNLLNVVSLALLALHAISFATPTNALSLQGDQMVRRHTEIAHRGLNAPAKRATNAKRCKARSSSAAPSSTKPAAVEKATTSTNKAAAATTTPKPASSTPTKAASSSGSSSGSSSSSSSNTGSGLRGKACLAWPNSGAYPLKPWAGSAVDLIYSWDENKPPGVDDAGLTYAPMLWGEKNAAAFGKTAVEGYAKIALGMNECNEVGQSNIDPQTGIGLWRQYLLPLADKGYTLISPAMSSRPNGKDWMQTFMADCGSDCKVSGIATHYYGTDIEEFKTYVQYWRDTYNLPVYVTEYADQDFNGGAQANEGEVWAFMEAATQFANANDWIHAHCWFGAMMDMVNVNPDNQLMGSNGAPNDLGNWFINN
ncbi:glycosyl hydrolase catalytic core-domain-containing protein, partial [Mycena pura]